MYSAYKIQIHPDHELFHYCDSLCFKAKNLYNITNYYIRQVYTALKKETRNENQLQVLKDIETHLSKMNEIRHKSYEIAKMKPKKVDKSDKIIDVKFKTFEIPHHEKSFIGYGFVEALFKVMKQVDYTSMPSQSNQQTMKKVYDDWKSFFESSKKYKINPAGFSGKTKIPKYKQKNGRTTCYLTNQITSIKEGNVLKLPGTHLQLNLGKIAQSERKLQQVRVAPSYGCYLVEVIFKSKQEKEIQRSEKQINELIFVPKRVMGIDLGVDNLATIVHNTGLKPLLIYTSKSSFLNYDPIPTFGDEHQTVFSGYRSTRAFYKIKGSKVLIHADVTGAFNIVRKHVKNAFEGLDRKQFLQAPQKVIIMKNRHAKLKA
jgi:putative transposase